jgi:arabinofuranosyltransferase
MRPTGQRNDVLAVILTVGLLELIRTAWISDDAAITLRCVLNFIHGYGPTFNIAERVEPYTHPLWFLLISALTALTRHVFASTFILSISISVLSLWLLLTRVARNFRAGVLAGSVLLLSKAYVDFSTSGLENPLAHLLMLLAVVAATDASVTTFFLLCSLIYLTRPDLLVMVLPLAALVLGSDREPARRLARSVAIGALPAIAWTIFSLYYYGFPFPNTVYAKLGAGVPLGERIVQGGRYLLDSLSRDFVTLPAITIGVVLAVRASLIEMALTGGSLLYIASVVITGGDFMSGRFLTASLVAAAVVIARSELTTRQVKAGAVALGLLALPTLPATLFSSPGYSDSRIGDDGIADERAYYFQRYGLVAPRSDLVQPEWIVHATGVSIVCGNLGFTGIVSGPGVHLIDECALSDPLLAHLPAERTRQWRIGHFKRQLPTDYEVSVAQGDNLLPDARTHAYYESIRTVTRGPLNSVDRLREVARLNLGLVTRPDWNMYYATKVPRSSGSS